MPYHRRRVSPCARWEIRDEWTRMDVYGLVARLVSPKHTLGDTDCTDLRTRRACRALDATGAPACVLDRSTSLHACAADRRAWEHRLWAMLGLSVSVPLLLWKGRRMGRPEAIGLLLFWALFIGSLIIRTPAGG